MSHGLMLIRCFDISLFFDRYLKALIRTSVHQLSTRYLCLCVRKAQTKTARLARTFLEGLLLLVLIVLLRIPDHLLRAVDRRTS